MRLRDLTAQAYEVPLRSLWETARGKSDIAYNVRATAVLEDGTTGYAEVSPRSYVTGETQESVLLAIAQNGAHLCGEDFLGLRAFVEVTRRLMPDRYSARALVEMAFFDALARSWGIPKFRLLGGAKREVRSDLSIPIATPEQTAQIAREAFAQGFRHLKIKVGGLGVEDEAQRVLAVREAAPGVILRVDANQAFDPEAAVVFIEWLIASGVPVECFEQPVSRTDLEGLAYVTQRSPVPVIADEAAVTPEDVLRLIRAEAAHGVNVKLAKSGITGSLDIIAIARAAGWKLMMGCMLESSMGIGMALHLACGTGAFQYIDLDSHHLVGEAKEPEEFQQIGEVLRLKF